jgi:hypothetical protein
MNVHYARYAAAKIARLERQIDQRLRLLAGARRLDEKLVARLVCDDTIALWLKDAQATRIIDRLISVGELIAFKDQHGGWSIKQAGAPDSPPPRRRTRKPPKDFDAESPPKDSEPSSCADRPR